jgi:hypothetical protein
MTIPNTHIDDLNKVIQVMEIPNTHIDELNKVIQVMTNPNTHIECIGVCHYLYYLF